MNLRKLFSFFSSDLGIDLGTANTLVYERGRGVVVNEPSLVALNKKTRKIEAIGREAKEMLSRTPRDLEAIEALKEGVIANFDLTKKMLRHFISKAQGDRRVLNSKVSSSAGESHPHALTEPDVKLAPHPAPTIQPQV
jgi:rod shape-determining protein MreB